MIVGEAFVQVKSLDKGYQAQLSGQVEKAGASVAKRLGKILAGAGIVEFGIQSVKAFSESEQASLKLQAAFEKFPALQDESAASFESLNKQLQLHTRFSDEDFAAAESTLAQFRLTGTQLRELIPLAADYAARTGQDLPSASTALGRALLGNTRALKAIGIEFKASGDRGKDFDAIMALLQEKVGGFADKQGKTAEGRLRILRNQFDEVQERVGSALIPTLETLVKVVQPVIEVFGSLPAPVYAAAAAITAGAVAVNLLNKSAQTGAIAKLVGLFSGAGPAVAGVAAGLLAGANAAKTNSDALADVNQHLKDLTEDRAGAFPALEQDIIGLNQAAAAAASGGLPAVSAEYTKMAAAIQETLDAHLKEMATMESSIEVHRRAASAQQTVTEGLREINRQYEEIAVGVKNYATLLDQTLHPILDVEAATDALTKKQKELTDAYAHGKGKFKGDSDAALENREKLRGLVEGIENVISAKLREGTITGGRISGIRHEISELGDLQATYPGLRAQIQTYIDKLNAIPGVKRTKVEADTGNAVSEIDQVLARLNALPANTNLRVNLTRTLRELTARGASGNTVGAGRDILVGERRPEVFSPDRNGIIRPDPGALPRGGARMGDIFIEQHFYGDHDERAHRRAAEQAWSEIADREEMIERTG